MTIRHNCSYCIYGKPAEGDNIFCCRFSPMAEIDSGVAIWPIVRPWYYCGEWSYTWPVEKDIRLLKEKEEPL